MQHIQPAPQALKTDQLVKRVQLQHPTFSWWRRFWNWLFGKRSYRQPQHEPTLLDTPPVEQLVMMEQFFQNHR